MVAPLPLPILYVIEFLLFLSWVLVSLNSIHSPLGHVNFSHSFSYQLYTEESHLSASSSELLPESKPILPTAHRLLDLHLKILLTPHLKLYRFKTDLIIFPLHQTCSSSCLHFLAQWMVSSLAQLPQPEMKETCWTSLPLLLHTPHIQLITKSFWFSLLISFSTLHLISIFHCILSYLNHCDTLIVGPPAFPISILPIPHQFLWHTARVIS